MGILLYKYFPLCFLQRDDILESARFEELGSIVKNVSIYLVRLSIEFIFDILPVPLLLFFFTFFDLFTLFITGSCLIQWSRSCRYIRFQSSTKWIAEISRSVLSVTVTARIQLHKMCVNQMERRPSANSQTHFQVTRGHYCAHRVFHHIRIVAGRHHIIDSISHIQPTLS